MNYQEALLSQAVHKLENTVSAKQTPFYYPYGRAGFPFCSVYYPVLMRCKTSQGGFDQVRA